ncbi:MAG TPA: alpha/beta hydrolase [Methylomirabilota bacterium]|nr:alpha/beta hydrolase [Methylomirabilota bacterium]
MLAYEVVGPRKERTADSLTLLCLHGNSSHRGIWRPVACELDEFRCVLLDMRGHGESERVTPPAYNPEHHAADLARVAGALVRGPYAVLAHSAGALASARWIAETRTDRSVPPPLAFVWVDIDPLVPRWQVEYFHQGATSVGRVFPTVEDALRGFRRIYPDIPDDRLRSFVGEGLCPADGGWRMKLDPATYATWEPGDVRAELPYIACPTLVLRGALSTVSSPEGLATLRSALPRCHVSEIAGGSHLLLLEHPQVVAASVRDFLSALGQPGVSGKGKSPRRG